MNATLRLTSALLVIAAVGLAATTRAKGKGKPGGGGGGGGGSATVTYDTIHLDDAYRDPTSVSLNTIPNAVTSAGNLNDVNQVAGAFTYFLPDPQDPSHTIQEYAACVWDSGIVYDLNDSLDDPTRAQWHLAGAGDINDAGCVIGGGEVIIDGEAFSAGFLYLPGSAGGASQVVWVTNGNDTVDSPAERIVASPIAINEHAEVVGLWNGGAYPTSSFYFNPATGDFVDLATLMGLPSGTGVDVRDINDSGQIVGAIYTGYEFQGFRYDMPSGRMEWIAPFRKSRDTSLGSGYAINETGLAVGFARTGNWSFEGFRLSPGGDMTSIGTLGGDSSYADDVNSAGVVLGRALPSSGPFRLVLHDSANGLREVLWEGSGLTTDADAARLNDQQVILSRRPTPALLVPAQP